MDTTNPPTVESIGRDLTALVCRLGALSPDEAPPGPNVDLFDAGVLDSLATVTLTAHIKAAYGVEIGDEDLFNPALTTIAGLTELITNRREPDTALR